MNLVRNLLKASLESGGQVEYTTELVLLRTCITEFSICCFFPAVRSLCPCIMLLEAIQEVMEVSIVISIGSFEILNLLFKVKAVQTVSPGLSQLTPGWDGSRKLRQICPTQ